MDARSTELLELDRIRRRLADECATEPGAGLALALAPSADPAEVARRAAETGEAVELERLGAARPGAATDARPLVEQAARGGALTPAELIEISVAARVAVETAAGVRAAAAAAPILAGQAERVVEPALSALADRVDAALDGHGGVRDAASPELASARHRLAEARRGAQDLLRELAVRLRPHLQEGFVTEREGRPVLAVRASSRTAVPGIVHDSSGSGATIFVEPMAAVEANNRVRELEATEREETERVLRRLTGDVADREAALTEALAALGAIDLALARARLARLMDAAPVEVGREVVLERARHPLLDPAAAVPIDLDLSGLRVLLVSGPNTGGKTVALKTVGLLALMHQCGLRVPARRARLPVFARVHADIGDEQSIAASLSTFSGHLRRVVAILAAAGAGSLVLLDEAMAGTDPAEGAALAAAVLEELAERGALVVTTTHSAELKAWAVERPDAANAAVGFDPEALAPTYEIVVGEAGPSNALQIAEGLGLPRPIVARARRLLAPERRRLEALVREAELARSRAATDRAATAEARRLADERAEELAAERDRTRRAIAEERQRARRAVERELAEATAELATLRREVSAARRAEGERRRSADARGDDLGRERDRRLGRAAEARGRAAARLVAHDRPAAPEAPLAVGDSVVDRSGLRGEIVAIDGGEAELRGPLGVVRIALDRLARDARARPYARPAAPVERRPESPPCPPEIDVRGRTAEEARAAVRAHVDLAALAGRGATRVIHGHGTGALRRAVREELDRHPLVASHTPGGPGEGGDGATVVTLRE